MSLNRITINAEQMGGVPCIRGLRIPVATVIEMLAEGMAPDEIMQAYPDLEREDISAALHFAADTLRKQGPTLFTSGELHEGEVYTRDALRQQFNITDATINTGIFQPAGYDSIWLFVTERKASDMTDYQDLLDGDILYWDGQTSGRKDALIVEHERRGLELLVFYRLSKQQYPGAGFMYEGRFRYVSHSGAEPTHFVLRRI